MEMARSVIFFPLFNGMDDLKTGPEVFGEVNCFKRKKKKGGEK